MEKDIIKDFPKLIEDVFDEFEAANNLYEPETGKTFMAHADFAEIVGKKYNMPDNELDSLLMIIVDNQMKDKNRPYMVSRDTFKQGSNVAQSVQDYVNGNPVTIEKSFTDQQQTMFEGTYQRKLPDTPTNVVDDILETQLDDIRILNDSGVSDQVDNIMAAKINDLYQTDGDIKSFSKYLNNLTPDTFTTPNKIKSILGFGKTGTGMRVTSRSINDGIGSRSPIIFDESRIDDLGYVTWKNLQHEYVSFQPSPNNVDGFELVKNLVKEGNEIDFESMTDVVIPDTPTNVVDEATNIYDVNEIENYANGNQRITPDQVTELEALTNTYKDQANNIVNKLPLEDTVKKKLRNKLSQMSVKWTTFSGAGELLDIYETGVLLFYGLVAAKPELEKIASNYMIDMYNTMAEPYGVKINRDEYTPDWENINEQLNKAEKITPTDIIIKKTKELAKDTGETGMVTGFGYVPTTKDKLNKTLAYPKPVEADVVDPMYDRIKRTFSGKFV
jgi:hypothetical protein